MFVMCLSSQEIGWAVLSAGWEHCCAGTMVISETLGK